MHSGASISGSTSFNYKCWPSKVLEEVIPGWHNFVKYGISNGIVYVMYMWILYSIFHIYMLTSACCNGLLLTWHKLNFSVKYHEKPNCISENLTTHLCGMLPHRPSKHCSTFLLIAKGQIFTRVNWTSGSVTTVFCDHCYSSPILLSICVW